MKSSEGSFWKRLGANQFAVWLALVSILSIGLIATSDRSVPLRLIAVSISVSSLGFALIAIRKGRQL